MVTNKSSPTNWTSLFNDFVKLIQESQSSSKKGSSIDLIEKKNSLLTDIVDLDYLETLYRKKFMVGKPNEKIYIK